MTDWIEHDGGPQPVADDVFVQRSNSRRSIGPAHWFDWTMKGQFRIINQHLIEKEGSIAAQRGYLQGLRSAKLAAMAVTKEYSYFRYQQFIDVIKGYEREVRRAMLRRKLESTRAQLEEQERETVLDKLAGEAQEQGMGYDRNVRYGVEVVRPPSAPLIAKEADQ